VCQISEGAGASGLTPVPRGTHAVARELHDTLLERPSRAAKLVAERALKKPRRSRTNGSGDRTVVGLARTNTLRISTTVKNDLAEASAGSRWSSKETQWKVCSRKPSEPRFPTRRPRKPLPETTRERLFIDLDTGHFALEAHVEMLAAMRQFFERPRERRKGVGWPWGIAAIATASVLPSIGHRLCLRPSCGRRRIRRLSNLRAWRRRVLLHLCCRLAILR
jgi:hypothetical protein